MGSALKPFATPLPCGISCSCLPRNLIMYQLHSRLTLKPRNAMCKVDTGVFPGCRTSSSWGSAQQRCGSIMQSASRLPCPACRLSLCDSLNHLLSPPLLLPWQTCSLSALFSVCGLLRMAMSRLSSDTAGQAAMTWSLPAAMRRSHAQPAAPHGASSCMTLAASPSQCIGCLRLLQHAASCTASACCS